MHWIVSGFLMFISSVGSYLLVRKSVLMKVPSPFTNLSMFLVPTVLFSLIAVAGKISIAVTWYQLLILVILAIFMSYLGNVFSLKSIEYAPNPGYSLVLSKSYVVFTTLAAIPLFHATLTPRAAVAIAVIVVSSALITITRNEKPASHVRPIWLPLAVGAFFCWGMLTLTSKYLLMIGVGTLSRLIYAMGIVSVIILTEMRAKKLDVRTLSTDQRIVLAGIGILSAGFNYFMQEGFVTAPNIGYINAMNASSIGLVVIGSAILFKDDFSPRKFVGVVGVIAGLVLLVL